ncbi:MAG: ABC transporter substrate-binding protein [Acidilobaceae archaeon]
MDKKFIGLILIIVLAIALIAGAAYYYLSRAPKTEPTTPEAEFITLRVGVLPVIDALTYHIASEEGLDRTNKIKLEILNFGSAKERDDAFVAGQLDVIMTDMIGLLVLRDRGFNVTVLLSAQATFYLVVSPALAGQIEKVEDISGRVRTIAISRATVIDFALFKILKDHNLDPNAFEIVEIRPIVDRFTALIDNRVDAAVLPEPWAPLAQTKGAKIVCSVTMPIVVHAIHSARLDAKVAKGFSEALLEASKLYKENPERYRYILEDRTRIGVPKEFVGWWVPRDLLRPNYLFRGVDSGLFEEVARWVYERGYTKKIYTVDEVVYRWTS